MPRLSEGSTSAAAVAQSGLGTGRQRHREGFVSASWCRRWQRLPVLVTAVAQGGGSSGSGKLRLGCGSCTAERALRLFGSGGEGGKFGMKTFGPPLV